MFLNSFRDTRKLYVYNSLSNEECSFNLLTNNLMKAPEKNIRIVVDLEGHVYYVADSPTSKKVKRAKSKHKRHPERGILPPLPAPVRLVRRASPRLRQQETSTLLYSRRILPIKSRERT